MVKDRAGMIRGWESEGGIYIMDSEQKKLWLWFDELAPDERLYWHKRILALPFSRPSFKIVHEGWRWSQSWQRASAFFTLTNSWPSTSPTSVLYDGMTQSKIVMTPIFPLVWEGGAARNDPPHYGGKRPPQKGDAYLFAMTFLDAFHPVLKDRPDIVEQMKLGPSLPWEMDWVLQQFASSKRKLAAHIYRTITARSVSRGEIATLPNFFEYP